jgi:hypothetical protein
VFLSPHLNERFQSPEAFFKTFFWPMPLFIIIKHTNKAFYVIIYNCIAMFYLKKQTRGQFLKHDFTPRGELNPRD